jgi:peptide/nickel transport system substrate-binding protein
MRRESLLRKVSFVGMVVCCAVYFMLIVPAWGAATSQKGKAAPAASKTETVKAVAQYGGTLKIAHAVDADNLGDPVARPMSSTGVRVAYTAVETLLRYNQKGLLVPWLATDWKIAKDLRSITFTLRKGVKFHDGTDFNAEAVKWNLDRYRTSNNAELKAVESVDMVDDSTIKLTLSKWSSTLIDNFTMHAGMMISPTSFQKNGADWAKTHPIGTGPFKFVSWQRDASVKFEKFSGYWQKGKPYLDGVEWTFITDMMSRTMAFKKGEMNVLLIIEPNDVKDLEKEGKYYFIEGGLSGLNICLAGDSGHNDSPFADVRVRQAVEHAIDKKALVDSLILGYGKVCNQYAYPGTWGVNPAVKGYPYDPAKAKKLLAEAGYPSGFKTTLYTPTWGNYVYPPPVIQQYLAKVGIDVQIEPVNQGRHQQLLRGGWKGLLVQQTPMILPDATNNLAVNASCKSYLKGSFACTEDYEAMLVRALNAPNFETKKKLTWEAQKLLIDKYALLNFFYTQPRINCFYKNVHDTGIGNTIDTQWAPEDAWISK